MPGKGRCIVQSRFAALGRVRNEPKNEARNEAVERVATVTVDLSQWPPRVEVASEGQGAPRSLQTELPGTGRRSGPPPRLVA